MAKGWFCGGAYVDSAPTVDAQACENWVPEQTLDGRLVLKARPGLDAFASAGPGPHRAAFQENGRAFVASGTDFREINADGTTTLRNAATPLAFSSEPATIFGNGTGGHQIYIVSGNPGKGYIFDILTNVFTQIADPDYPTDVVMGFYINGHFGAVERNSRRFAISTAFDGTAWSALDIGEKSKTTDSIIAAIVDKDAGELWLIGPNTIEVWWYSGAAAFPLEPVPNLTIPSGGSAGFSWTNVGGSVYGLAQSTEGGIVVVRFQAGYSPERISTHPIDTAIQGYNPADIANARAFAIEWQGHRCYVVTFVDAMATWIFDEASNLWSRWTYLNPDTGGIESFLGTTHMFVFGKHLVGSRLDGTLYELSPRFLDDDGHDVRCMRRSPYIGNGPHRLVHTRLWFDVETGVGVVGGADEDVTPIGMVRYSDDGAKTWSAERQVSLGAAGQFGTLAELWRLGLAGAKGRVYEYAVTAAVVRAINDADIETAGEA